MEHVMRKIVLAAFTLLALSGAAVAQNFPSRPITIIVPFSAGGPSDVMARILAERMKVALGEAVLVENVSGAGGSIGVGRAVRSPPDGYTISFGHLATHVANGAIYKLGNGLVAGRIARLADQRSHSINQGRAGTLRGYAGTDTKRAESATDIPTADEAGLPGFHMTLWSGLWVPKRTPKEIVTRLNAVAVE